MTPDRSRRSAGFGSSPLARLAISALAITTGGVMLGGLLALHANPQPRPRPATTWEQLFRPEVTAQAQPRLMIEAPPTDLHPGGGQAEYRPDLDYDTLVTGWAPPPMALWEDQPEAVAPAEPVAAPIERAADAAELAAAEAVAQAAVPPAPPVSGTEDPRSLW